MYDFSKHILVSINIHIILIKVIVHGGLSTGETIYVNFLGEEIKVNVRVRFGQMNPSFTVNCETQAFLYCACVIVS